MSFFTLPYLVAFTTVFLEGEKFGESYVLFDQEYVNLNKFTKVFMKTTDFFMGKDGYKFITWEGQLLYLMCMIFLNLTINNISIAILAEAYQKAADFVSEKANKTYVRADILAQLYCL